MWSSKHELWRGCVSVWQAHTNPTSSSLILLIYAKYLDERKWLLRIFGSICIHWAAVSNENGIINMRGHCEKNNSFSSMLVVYLASAPLEKKTHNIRYTIKKQSCSTIKRIIISFACTIFDMTFANDNDSLLMVMKIVAKRGIGNEFVDCPFIGMNLRGFVDAISNIIAKNVDFISCFWLCLYSNYGDHCHIFGFRLWAISAFNK